MEAEKENDLEKEIKFKDKIIIGDKIKIYL